jgi:phosphopantetheine adenylyltransferase
LHKNGTVYAVVGRNVTKKYLVTPEERCELLKKVCANDKELSNVKPVVVEGFIWKFGNQQDARKKTKNNINISFEKSFVFYRGIRNWTKDGADERSLFFLNMLGPILLGWRRPPEIRFLQAPESGIEASVSSSEIRKRLKTGKPISDLVPLAIEQEVTRFYLR